MYVKVLPILGLGYKIVYCILDVHFSSCIIEFDEHDWLSITCEIKSTSKTSLITILDIYSLDIFIKNVPAQTDLGYTQSGELKKKYHFIHDKTLKEMSI